MIFRSIKNTLTPIPFRNPGRGEKDFVGVIKVRVFVTYFSIVCLKIRVFNIFVYNFLLLSRYLYLIQVILLSPPIIILPALFLALRRRIYTPVGNEPLVPRSFLLLNVKTCEPALIPLRCTDCHNLLPRTLYRVNRTSLMSGGSV